VVAAPELYEPRGEPYVDAMFGEGPGAPSLGLSVSETRSLELAAAYVGSATSIDVRGHAGYLVQARGGFGLVWKEAPGFVLSLGTQDSDFTVAELLAIADKVSFVDEATWRSIYDVCPARFPTTTSAP